MAQTQLPIEDEVRFVRMNIKAWELREYGRMQLRRRKESQTRLTRDFGIKNPVRT